MTRKPPSCKTATAWQTLGLDTAMYSQELIRSLRILRMEQSGSLLTLTVRGERSEVLRLAQAQNPVFAEVLPLTLEEIFISETEVAGYDIKNFLY